MVSSTIFNFDTNDIIWSHDLFPGDVLCIPANLRQIFLS